MDSSFLEGDPAAMRAFAATLRQTADRVAQIAASVDARALAAVFEGPAADRFRRAVGTLERTEGQAAQELRDLAARVARVAGEVEAAQAAERRRLEREAEERLARERAR